MERQDNAERLPPATTVAEQLKHDTNMCKAMIWVNKMGPETYNTDGHDNCDKEHLLQSQTHNPDLAAAAEAMEAPGLYPVKSNLFYRGASPIHGTTYDETTQGEILGDWCCAGCAGRWSHACGLAKRLLVTRRYDDGIAVAAYCNVSIS